MKTITETNTPYAPLFADKISPKEIDATKHFFDAFGHCETEISAGYIVRLCQEFGEWRPFTRQQIEEIYSRKFKDRFIFNRLIGSKWIVQEGELFHVTDDFIIRCYKSSPAKVG